LCIMQETTKHNRHDIYPDRYAMGARTEVLLQGTLQKTTDNTSTGKDNMHCKYCGTLDDVHELNLCTNGKPKIIYVCNNCIVNSLKYINTTETPTGGWCKRAANGGLHVAK